MLGCSVTIKNKREIFVRPFADTPGGGYAIDPDARLIRIGSVERKHRIRDGMIRRIWEGTMTTGEIVTAGTKGAIVKLMIENAGYVDVGENATIPDLLAGLGE